MHACQLRFACLPSGTFTDDGIAIVAFGGGCNGCSMVDVTLKEGIEKELLNQFVGELTAVRDATEHDRGDHSYY